MAENSYTIEEISHILKVSKLTVYDLIKKGQLKAYRVGRQMRVDESDLEAYKSAARMGPVTMAPEVGTKEQNLSIPRPIIISGQDVSLDILSKHMEKENAAHRALRSYAGSLNSLIALYRGECDIVSLHLFDGETHDYNVPYTRKILTGQSYVVINLLYRWAGFYVQKGNPKVLNKWKDLARTDIHIINREKGSGARILLDEQLSLHQIKPRDIKGYAAEESNHLGVAGAVAQGRADVGIGIEKAAYMVGVDFIPLIKERYDLVIKKSEQNEELIQKILSILRSKSFQREIESIGGYDLSQTGKIMFETN